MGAWTSRRFAFVALAISSVLAIAAYGGVLDNFFYEIDDASQLHRASLGLPISGHFRPFYQFWNAILVQAFGTRPFPYYAVGLAVHVLNAALCGALVRRITASASLGLAAVATFALLYSPAEAVLWIAANDTELVVFAILLASLAWRAYLDTRRKRDFALAFGAAMLAMASKEESVVLAPIFVGLDVHRNGWRSLASGRTLARYAPFAVLAAIYLSIAYRPDVWRKDPSVGHYDLDLSLAPAWFGNFALLFSVGRTQLAAESIRAASTGIALVVVLVAAARLGFARRERKLALFGLAVALFGMLPALPGRIPIAQSRLCYVSAIGVACIVVAVASAAWSRASASRSGSFARWGTAIAFGAWLVLDLDAIRSLEAWRYRPRGDRFERLVESTRDAVRELALASPKLGKRAVVISPPVWSSVDYEEALGFFCGDRVAIASTVEFANDDEVRAQFAAGARFDLAQWAVFTGRADGSLRRVRTLDELAHLEHPAASSTRNVPVVAFRVLPDPTR